MSVTVSDYTALLSGSYWTGDEITGQPAIVTYSFPTTVPPNVGDDYSPSTVLSWRPFNATERAAARAAMDEFEAAAGIRFIEVRQGLGDIVFNFVNFDTTPNAGISGFAYHPGHYWQDNIDGVSYATSHYTSAGDVYLNTQKSFDYHSLVGILLHEVGHAVGLKHPFDGDDPDHPETLAGGLDHTSNTVMSYTGPLTITLGQFDRIALHHIHGAMALPFTWSYDALTETVTIDGNAGADLLTGTSTRDIISGASGNDTIIGYEGDDVLDGGGGDDTVYGGPGSDTVKAGPGTNLLVGGSLNVGFGSTDSEFYEPGQNVRNTFVAPLVSSLAPSFTTIGDFDGEDDIIDISGFGFASFADLVVRATASGSYDLQIEITVGGRQHVVLIESYGFGQVPRPGDFQLDSSEAVEVFGTAGNDVLIGLGGMDTVAGLVGNDTLTGGGGGDTLDGGEGRDAAGHGSAAVAVFANLANPGANSGDAAGDSYFSIEDLYGSVHNDTLVGDGGGNTINGQLGNDSVFGNAGNDRLDGEDGKDTLFGGGGVDTLVGGADNDFLRGETDADRLFGGPGNDIAGGDAGKDTLFGGTGDDRLLGNSENDFLRGEAGNDSLFGGIDDDIMGGDAGLDRLFGGAGLDKLLGNADDDFLRG